MFGAQKAAADFGFNSIGAVATTKIAQNALTSGFPSAYQSVYAARGVTPKYFPTVTVSPSTPFTGNDLQSQWHQLKKADADRMARAKVIATQHSRVRYVGTPHGAGVLPPTILGQRVFANPSYGAFVTDSARQTHSSAPFHLASAQSNYTSGSGDTLRGGVLRSIEGQQYGKRVLTERVAQLNKIQQMKQSFVEGRTDAPSVAPADSLRYTSTQPHPIGQSALIELNLLLQSVADAVIGGEDVSEILHLSSLTYKDTTRAVTLIFGVVPSMSQTEIDELYATIDLITTNLDTMLSNSQTTLPANEKEIALTLQVIFSKLRTYTQKMIAGHNLSPKEKIDLSKALVTSLGFAKILKYAGDSYRELLDVADLTQRQRQRAEEGDIGSEDEDDDDRFDRPAPTREDSAHQYDTGVSSSDRDFTSDVRQEFGAQSGQYFPIGNAVRGIQQFFGEGPIEEAGDMTIGSLPPVAPTAPAEPLDVADAVGKALAGVVGSYFDKDTQEFNLSSKGAKPGAPALLAAEPGKKFTFTRQTTIPTKQSDLPTTLDGYRALSEALSKSSPPIHIGVNATTPVANLRRNFIKRLGLVGKY